MRRMNGVKQKQGRGAGNQRIVILQILVFAVLFLGVWALLDAPKLPEEAASIEGGVIDLTGLDLDHTIAVLPLEFEYYPDELYTAEDFAAGTTIPPRSFEMGVDDRAHRTGTYRARLKLPPGRTYALYAYSLDYAMRVYYNGVKVDEVGVVSQNAEEFVPRVLRRVILLDQREAEGELILQYANFVHFEGGNLLDLTLSTAANIDNKIQRELTQVVVLCGALLFLSFYHFSLFLSSRKTEVLLFAICCLCMAIRNERFYFQFVTQAFDWLGAIRLLYIGSVWNIAVFTFLAHSLYPERFHRAVQRFTAGAASLFTLAVLLFPPMVFTRILPVYSFVCVLPVILYYLVRMAPLLRSRRPGDRLSLFGFGMLLGTAGFDMVWRKALPLFGNGGLMPLGVLVFVFCNMLLLNIRAEENAEELTEATVRVESLREAGKMKTEFLANISHDLKTPLTVLNNYLELLEDDAVEMSEQERAEYLGIAYHKNLDLQRLVHDLFEVTRIEDGAVYELERVPAGALLEEAAQKYADQVRDKGVSFSANAEEGLELFIDRGKIWSVLDNLVYNALRHTPVGGSISVCAQRRGGLVALCVADTGEGIPPEHLPHIFERFYKVSTDRGEKDGSSGLGLYIVRTVTEAMGGTVSVESEPGRGTLFTLLFPTKE